MIDNNALAIIEEIRQLQAEFETGIASGKTFEEVRGTYLKIKALIDRLDQPEVYKMNLGRFRRDKTAG